MTLTPRLLGRTAVAALLGLVATGAVAADRDVVVSSPEGVTRSVEVRYTDLDLTTTRGQARLESRIDVAARQACDIHAGSVVDKLPSAKACFAQARTSAYARLQTLGVPVQLAMN